MTAYFFYQEKEKSKWLPALASDRQNLIRTKKPALVSVLDADNDFSEELDIDEIRAVRYFGPMYFDFDAADLNEATQQFQKFLMNLKAKGVNLEMLRLFATGKKGYHIEVPSQMLMGKPSTVGTPHLPHIYKEIAHALYVDTLDLRVYSAKRGRMWRCPNVKREDNGQYKVQLTVDEAFAMTGESYSQVCSSPRNSLPIEPPAVCSVLGLLFAQAKDKVEKSIVKAKKTKSTSNTLSRFKNEWPETLNMILLGVGIKPDVGWNHISIQLAVTASALGKSEETLLQDAAPLIEGHAGDSDRYGSARKRRDDLREMYRYVNGNPCYEFSVGGILSLILPELRANADISFGDFVPDEKVPRIVTETVTETRPDGTITVKEVTREIPPEDDEQFDDSGKIKISKSGVHFKAEDSYRSVCDMGFLNPISMRKLNGDHIGYEVDTYIDSKDIGKHFIPMNAFTSKSQFNNWSLNHGASMRASDIQTSSLSDYFRKRSSKNPVYAVEREGIDVVVPPGTKDLNAVDVIWASPEGVVTLNKTVSYRYHGIYNAQGTYKSDLMMAPPLSLEDEEFVGHLLEINDDAVVAKLLGWFCAAFLTQLIRRKFKRFPSMQVFGQAGAGKSMSVILLNHMHYHAVEPRQFGVSGQTMFPLIVAVATSASLPLVFEEMKTRQLSKATKDFLQNILRSNYTADQLQRGSLGRDKSVREPTVTDFANAAPICFVGEAIEDQAAILERCVVVALSKSGQKGREGHFEYCMDHATHMGRIGKRLAEVTLSLDREVLNEEVNRNFKMVTGLAQAAMIDGASRPAFNLAVTLTGLELLRMGLESVFNGKFNARIQVLKESILDNVSDSIPRNMSEASRVLDTMAQLSRSTDESFRLMPNLDYTINEDGKTMDLKLRTAFSKYVKWQRSLGMEVLFDHENAFIQGMTNYAGVTQRACPGNIYLYDSPKAVIYRLSIAYMDKEGVDSFK